MSTFGDVYRFGVSNDPGEVVLHASRACGVLLPSLCLPCDPAMTIGVWVLILHGDYAVCESVVLAVVDD